MSHKVSLYTRNRLDEVEHLLLDNEDYVAAARILRAVRIEYPRKPGSPDLFDGRLAADPTNDYLLYVRSLAYRKAAMPADGARDLLRSALVCLDKKACAEALDDLATIEGANVEPWMCKAVSALAARGRGDRKDERQCLLEAVRGAPNEITLFAALARLENGTCSDIELFALRQCLRVAPAWKAARIELRRAARAIRCADAFEDIEAVVETRAELAEEIDEDRTPSGRHRRAA